MRGLSIGENGDGGILVKAEAGVLLSELVNLSVRESLTGMEFCAGIPGSVGGAVRMNAGAYGSEIKDIVAVVRLFDPSEGFRTANRDTLSFSYRNLDLPFETIIIGAVFRMQRGDTEGIAGRVREILAGRREKHPLEFPNAGSVFKNPRGIPAGRLIEEAGLKGIRTGDAQISEKHGNFIVNRGHATAGEILFLIALVQQRVFEATGHALETEVRIIGE
jgi:UDP-N-acetylmuramate dehydrogenase